MQLNFTSPLSIQVLGREREQGSVRRVLEFIMSRTHTRMHMHARTRTHTRFPPMTWWKTSAPCKGTHLALHKKKHFFICSLVPANTNPSPWTQCLVHAAGHWACPLHACHGSRNANGASKTRSLRTEVYLCSQSLELGNGIL